MSLFLVTGNLHASSYSHNNPLKQAHFSSSDFAGEKAEVERSQSLDQGPITISC